MTITKDAITGLTEDDRVLLWEALRVYYQHCATNAKAGHCAKDIFEERMGLMEAAMDVAYTAWERTYH